MRTILVSFSLLAIAISPAGAATGEEECIAGSTIDVLALNEPVTEPGVVSCSGFTCTALECVGTFACERAGGCEPHGKARVELQSGRVEMSVYVDGAWQVSCSLVVLATGGWCELVGSEPVAEGATYTVRCVLGAAFALDVAFTCRHEP